MKLSTYLQRARVVTVSLLLTVTTLPAITHANTTITAFPNSVFNPVKHQAGTPVTASSLPNGILRQQIEALPTTAQTRALNKLSGINFSSSDLPYLRTDSDGGIYIEDHFDIPAYLTNEPQAIDPLYQSITSSEAFSLHSKPDAAKVIYLDFNGHVITGTAWDTKISSYNALPYDLDGDTSSFNANELASIAQIWRRTAEDFAPFDVDVTTEEPATFTNNTGRALITKNRDADNIAMPGSSGGGIAYVGVWGQSNYQYYSPALVYYNNLGGGRADFVTEALSHEMGHNLGLSHDGTSTKEYYGGSDTGNTSWGPIMGTGYTRNVSQWSKGEYSDANNQEDDVNIIAGYLNNRTDDHSDTSESATPIVTDGTSTGNIVSTTPLTDPSNFTSSNKGIIETQGDADTFQFDTIGGTVTLNASSFREASNTHGGNLDIEIILRDSLGTLVEQNDDTDDTNATITVPLAAGRYYLTVNGGDDPTSPYSDYGSLGQYFLSGNIPQSVGGNDTTPDAFTFTDQTDVALSSVITSAPITVGGINMPADISISGGEYSIDGAAYVTSTGTVHDGASVSVRHTSSASHATSIATTLTIGGVTDTFTSTTLPAPVATHTLNVTKTGTGSGTVTSAPAGINCGTDCTETYATSGKIIKLTAVVGTNSIFNGWSGACNGMSTTCTVTVTDVQNVTATFNYITYPLTVTKEGNGTVNSSPVGIDCGADCTEVFNKNSTVTLTATPDAGYRFIKWTGGCRGTATTCTVSMNAAKSVTATFKPIFTLTVNKVGTGTGTVTSKPAGIDCGADCTEDYLDGTTVTLTAKATKGSRFSAWSGSCSGSKSTCRVTLSEAKAAVANFVTQ